jgi:predicted ester cyclase
MSELNQALGRHVAAFNTKDADAEPWGVDAEMVAPGAHSRGRQQILDWLGGYWEAFPDARLEIARSIEQGALVSAEGKMIGTHTGVLRTAQGEVPPTGRSVEIRFLAMYETEGDKLLSEHLYFDSAEFMMQLGL